MTPTERRRPITRRKRIAHLGIGGVLAAVAGAQAGTVLADSHHEPSPAIADPPAVSETQTAPAPVTLTAPREHIRLSAYARHRRAPRPAPADLPQVWKALGACESGNNPRDTAGEFEGEFQFLNSTWLEYGGGTYAAHAYDATEAQQLTVARSLLDADGPHPWPVCGPKVGLARGD